LEEKNTNKTCGALILLFLTMSLLSLSFSTESASEDTSIPILKVLPAKVENLPMYSTFDVGIWIFEVDPQWDIVGFDITINFDPKLIEAVAITEGEFLLEYSAATFEVVKVIDNAAGWTRYALIQVPPRTPPSPTSGILFTITYRVIYESPPTYRRLSCSLTISPSIIVEFPEPTPPTPPFPPGPPPPVPHEVEDGFYVSRGGGLGDVNGDGEVDIHDIVLACTSYGSKEGYPNWNPYADLAPPLGTIDVYDIVTIVSNYGKKYP
jgi:hypothetical protein